MKLIALATFLCASLSLASSMVQATPDVQEPSSDEKEAQLTSIVK